MCGHRLLGVVVDPVQIGRQAGVYWDCHDFRKFIRVERSETLLKFGITAGIAFDYKQIFAAGLDLVMPAVDRFNARDDVDASGQFLLYQCGGDVASCLLIRTGVEHNVLFCSHGGQDTGTWGFGQRRRDP